MESTLSTLRLRLAEAQAVLRTVKDDHGRIKAEREQAAIKAANGTLGKNQDERDRALTLALATDQEYQRALALMRRAEAQIDQLSAQIENALDMRRSGEWQIRARLVDAIMVIGTPIDDPDLADTATFDDATFEQVVSALERFARDKRHQYRGVAREMVDAYNSGVAERINGAGEYEPDELSDQVDRAVERFAQGRAPEQVSRHRLDGPQTALDYYNSDAYRTIADLERADADAFMHEWAPETFKRAA